MARAIRTALGSSPARGAREPRRGDPHDGRKTAKDMHARYKETAEGGLAQQIPVNAVEC